MPNVGPHPGASSPAVSRRMSSARRRDTKPEVDVRRVLHARGLRYRVAYPVPGMVRRSIDIAFTKAKVAVFLDGCFWHGCPEHGTQPRANADWWALKLQQNKARDAETDDVLESTGWRVLRFWEHEGPESVADRICSVVQARN
ncbi:very short patch repair endonuclease [Agromyces sp. H3Y2-19a]|uniref:very short patch repair endonuclease n=1 Tax=Agromyces chromiiresistens TaxID=3030835 RepID=UPI0023BA29C3|nr:very short patch repair endonuclease [Agromyces chromiiresistens]MDF0512393.1 very short patch repair endonuclease [Agromyces chromiiresistens]